MTKNEYIEKYYAKTPKHIDEFEDRHQKILDIILTYSSNKKIEKILDIGCGDGNFSFWLKEACNAKEVYGIDISQKAVELAKEKGINAYQLDIDAEDFLFEDNYFDLIFAGEIIEHLYDPDHFLEEVYRVIKFNHIFILSTPNLSSIYNRFALLLGFQPNPMGVSHKHPVRRLVGKRGKVWAPEHIRVLTLRSLKDLFKFNKFEILTIYGIKASTTRLPYIIQAIDKIISRFPVLAQSVLVVARAC